MALVTSAGTPFVYPGIARINGVPALSVSAVIDASTEKIAMCGRAWNKDRVSKDVTKVGFRFGAVTKAGGSALTVSLQDVSLTAGAPMQPDGVQDQTVAIANADAGFVSNVWYQTNAFSAARTVGFGELLAVVIEYDGGGRLATDTVVVNSLTTVEGQPMHQSVVGLFTGAWASQAGLPMVVLEFTDGSFGTLQGAWPCSNVGVNSYHSATAVADEYAIEFSLPWPCKVTGAWGLVGLASNACNFDVVLYDGTTPLASASVDGNANGFSGTTGRPLEVLFPSEITLAANTTYRLSFMPTQGSINVVLHYFDVANANHFQAHAGGTAWSQTSRLDLGAWAAPTPTRRPFAGLLISAMDDGAGGGGGTNNYTIVRKGGAIMRM